jgi:hypothetical protein
MRLTTTGLGIGTSSPARQLDVKKTAIFDSNGDGTTTNPSVAIGSSGVGLSYIGSQQLAFITNSTEKMRLDSSGNLGLGVTPNTWLTSFKAIQLGQGSSLWGAATGNNAAFDSNAYVNTSGSSIYVGSTFATRYQQNDGAHKWSTAASGTAGNAITFTQALTLDSSGSLLVGDTSAPSNGINTAAVSTKGQGTSGSRRATASSMGVTSSLAQNATANTYTFGGYGGYGLFVCEGSDPSAAWRAAAIVWSTGAALTILNLGSSNITVGSSGTTVTVQNTNASSEAIGWSMLVLG